MLKTKTFTSLSHDVSIDKYLGWYSKSEYDDIISVTTNWDSMEEQWITTVIYREGI